MEIIKKSSYCKRCDYDTNHTILFKERVDGDENYHCMILYMIAKCDGCDRISFREEFVDFESAYPDDEGNWEPEITVTTYPKEQIKQKLEDIYVLPEKIKIVYTEAISAFNSDCFLLTGVAFRAVIEAICIEKNIIGKDLAKKIDSLVKQKLITEKEAQRLHSIRFLGNDSVHEMNVPEKEKLLIVLNIIEHLLNNLYIIDYQTKHHLETIIAFYPEFETLLNLNLKQFVKNDELPLAKILGKSIRRFNGKLQDFENELKTKIKSRECTNLLIGKVGVYGNGSNPVQHFILN
jgi:hypothetical protein